jgi:hypothetical protein
MRFSGHRIAGFALATLFACATCDSLPKPSHEKTIWDYDGGVWFITNGSITNGPCFRINGRVTAAGFFDNFKRIDDKKGTTFLHGGETVTNFPEQLLLTFIVHDQHDQTCPPQLENTGSPAHLTRAEMSELHLELYWKRGIELRRVNCVTTKYFSVDPISPNVPASGLPEKLQWSYEFVIPSAGVPLTDSLVLILRGPDNRIAARVAARL